VRDGDSAYLEQRRWAFLWDTVVGTENEGLIKEYLIGLVGLRNRTVNITRNHDYQRIFLSDVTANFFYTPC